MIPLDELLHATQADQLVPGVRSILDGFAHDSRLVIPGDCFVAVRGAHSDGHDFLVDAIERGAGALLVKRDRLASLGAELSVILDQAHRSGVAILAVSDTRLALRSYAAHILDRWKPCVVAITGAAGKTTTKEAIADVLSLAAPTFRSWRNYNDLLGIPLCLGRLEPTHAYAVVELGADRPGEIADLCAIVRPRIGVVTNVSAAHLLYFGSLAAYATELTSLLWSLPSDGLAVINGDDPLTRDLAVNLPARALAFSTTGIKIVSADPLTVELGDHSPDEPIEFSHLHGAHWLTTVLAALTVGESLGVPRQQALETLSSLLPPPGRMRRLEGFANTVLLDDTHNATPASASAGLAALTSVAAKEQLRASPSSATCCASATPPMTSMATSARSPRVAPIFLSRMAFSPSSSPPNR